MNSFEDYLKGLGLKLPTVYQHRKYSAYFLAWLATESLNISQLGYTEILDYADHQRQAGHQVNLVNRMKPSRLWNCMNISM